MRRNGYISQSVRAVTLVVAKVSYELTAVQPGQLLWHQEWVCLKKKKKSSKTSHAVIMGSAEERQIG